MPLLRKPILKPIVGLNYMDPSTMLNDRGGFPKNIRLSRNDLRKREGKSLFQTSPIIPGTAINHICQYPLASQSIRLIRFSRTTAEKYNNTLGIWTDITGADFGGADTDFYSTVTAENKLLIANYVNNTRQYNDAGVTTDIVASSGTVPKAKFLEYNKGYLLAAYVDILGASYPTRVSWSDTGDITDWGSGNAGSTYLYHDPLPIRGMKNLNEFTVVYKKNSIYNGRTVDTSDIFIFDQAYSGIGLSAGRALVDYQGTHYFMGTDDFYLYRGVRPESIASDTVKREVFGRLDGTQTNKSFALLVQDLDEVWFFVVISGNTWPTEIWKFNYRTGFWYFDTCSETSAAGLYTTASSIIWNDLIGTWNDQTFRWDDAFTTTDAPIYLLGDTAGNVLKYDTLVNDDNNVAIDAEWQSMDFTADKFEYYKRWLQLDFEAKGVSVDIAYSIDYGNTWTSIKTNYTLTPSWPNKMYRVYFDIVARNIRFRFRNNRLGETFYLRQFYPYYLDREEANT